MASSSSAETQGRVGAYGQHRAPTPVDRLGVWLSGVAVRRHAQFESARLGDFGCGYEASFARTQLNALRSALLVDFALAPDLKAHPKVMAIEGSLPEMLGEVDADSLDVTLCLSVLEHLWKPEAILFDLRRVTAPGGVVLLNVPSWLGKSALELAAIATSSVSTPSRSAGCLDEPIRGHLLARDDTPRRAPGRRCD
jgi:2-polyprenyl-3-methyl-5-hydroxy-6-metoxy-1,4-benzoquinol methylase